MLYEPTTLAATATAIAEAVQAYGCEPAVLFRRAGLEMSDMQKPGARYPLRDVMRLWKEARLETEDPCIGLYAARHLKPQALHALGLSWLASRTLLDGLHRMARYVRIANTSLRLSVSEANDQVKLTLDTEPQVETATEAIDAAMAFVIKMCRLMTDRSFAPLLVTFMHDDNGHIEQYIDCFQAPIYFGRDENALIFDAPTLEEPIPSGNEALAQSIEQSAARYLATLDPSRVRDRVREILLTLLPSGEVSQQAVARSLHRSPSALQRSLKAEGVSYRTVLDDTRHELALKLVGEQRYSLGQIAYLLGFSDQANFSRAFKRWTGSSPREYR